MAYGKSKKKEKKVEVEKKDEPTVKPELAENLNGPVKTIK